MKRHFLCLLLLISLIAPIPLVHAVMFGRDVDYITPGGGTIIFASDFNASLMDFDVVNNFIRFLDFNFSGTVYSEIGFACDTANAIMNVTSITPTHIMYTVMAPAGTISQSRVYAPSKGVPESVSGCIGWLYDTSNSIITIITEHTSPVDITISWAPVSPPGGPSGGTSPPGTWTPPPPPPPTPIVPPLQPPSSLLNFGIIVILIVVSSAALYQEAEKRAGSALKSFRSRKLTISGKTGKEFKKRKKSTFF